MLAENVVRLNNNQLFDDIEAFLNELEVHSKGTRISYESDIRKFFRTLKNKEIEHLTIDDLTFKKKDIINYRKYLMDNNLSNNTINNKITSVKSMYDFLSSEYEVNANVFNIKTLKVQSNPYGSLSQTEAERMAEVAYETEREDGYLKKMLILFAIRSSFRKNEILNVKWSDFEEEKGVYKVKTVVGKGQKQNTTAISAKLYNQILELKEMNKGRKWSGDPEIVFQISPAAIDKLMARLRNKMGISKERNVVFHSFRGIAIDFSLSTSNGNITEAAIHANHSSPATTFKHYVNKTKDYTQTPGVRMDQQFDLSFLADVSIEDLKDFIKQSSLKVQMDLKDFLEKK
ncbi:site-specific integrase [Bacillus sp. UMB0728]|uniref:site-specific integrase n=1 Tax=Bacillus sp. UMB0728 TaxID=2066052 RepID=UPI000C779330|nr:site-specific integrase [Bacillus sp. UMB0728]PLR72226.1 hypothetical protein CYJ37_11770 [Bacillus sp. UMB0728]